MGDNRKHRGQHPDDSKLFAESAIPAIQQAVSDLEWLLSRGYSEKSSLRLVGDRFRLRERQRRAVRRSVCSDQDMELRARHRIEPDQMSGKVLLLDGFNVLITVESALSGGLIFEGRDTCYRDMASIHGSYKRVIETQQAILLIGRFLKLFEVSKAVWYFDQPVSNSGRLKTMLGEIAAKRDWPWEIHLVYNPDKVLIKSSEIVSSSDSLILNRSAGWLNLAREVIDRSIPDAQIIRLSS